MNDRRTAPENRPWTRRSFLTALSATAVAPRVGWAGALGDLPTPTPSQLLWQRDERALFVHFGINTFTDREWGDGTESPTLFNPDRLDCDQWARVARESGFRAMILTAKHHDGFCLWPTATTGHSVAASPYRGGSGDVVAEFVTACGRAGLRAGLYLSPWDRNSQVYGDSSRYNDFYVDQLTELLGNYGQIHEVWFDGANGEGPGGRHQVYDWDRYWSVVRRLQPEAVIFSDAGPDLRWIGNERGSAGETNWSTVDPSVVTRPGMSGPAVTRQLQEGDRGGSAWRPGETDVSIRPGWFYHSSEDDRVRSAADLTDLYFTSVGRNSKLLLNVPPTPGGIFHPTDVERLHELERVLDDLLGHPLAAGRLTVPPTGDSSGVATLTRVDGATPVGIIDLAEPIGTGQRVARHAIDARVGGHWIEVASATTIGYRRLHRVEPVRADAFRVRILESLARPDPIDLRVHAAS